jgi:hypothetical protein
MPSKIVLNQTFTVFGARIIFESDNREALDAASALFKSWDEPDLFDGTSISIVSKEYDVNEPRADASQIEGASLTIIANGITAQADGATGIGLCEYPRGTATCATFAEQMNTVTLFLLAHAGRTPVHASAVMFGDTAIVFAGPSGSGKSSLALAANRAGLPVLSDDTVFVQTAPHFRIWSLPQAIHVLEKDAQSRKGDVMRFRSGRWKHALNVTYPRHMATCAALCVLEKGDAVALKPLTSEEAIAALTGAPEPGYEFYGRRSEEAVRALAAEGCWRLTLSSDPSEAINMVRCQFTRKRDETFHGRYLALVDEIEARFDVAHWKCGDVDIWPFARMDLYLDMHWQHFGGKPPAMRPLLLRVAAQILRSAINLWRSRSDLAHFVWRPRPAHAIVLGDGVSLDRIDGAYRDRFTESIITALKARGLDTFLMQSGDLSRLPWHRPTYAASQVEARGFLFGLFNRKRAVLPDHEKLLEFLASRNVSAPSLARAVLARRARITHSTTSAFEHVLKKVKPKLAFVVTYYAGLGHAFVLACRRQGILSVDVQHCPQRDHKAYSWHSAPVTGYSTLPAMFWNWTEAGAASIRRRTDSLPAPWHRSLHGGHMQIAFFTNEKNAHAWDTKFRTVARDGFEREILVALQPIGGQRALWNALADQIEASPPTWRWWIRRHPSARAHQDTEFGCLMSIRKNNVLINETSEFPLPILLRHMSAVISFASGTAAEAALFGVPAFFLSEEAKGQFGDLIKQGAARITDVRNVNAAIARLEPDASPKSAPRQPDIYQTLEDLEIGAQEYRKLCADDPL